MTGVPEKLYFLRRPNVQFRLTQVTVMRLDYEGILSIATLTKSGRPWRAGEPGEGPPANMWLRHRYTVPTRNSGKAVDPRDTTV